MSWRRKESRQRQPYLLCWTEIIRSPHVKGWLLVSVRCKNPDSKVHGVNMGPTWVLSAPDWPHVGPMNIAIRERLWTQWQPGSVPTFINDYDRDICNVFTHWLIILSTIHDKRLWILCTNRTDTCIVNQNDFTTQIYKPVIVLCAMSSYVLERLNMIQLGYICIF